MWTRHGAAVVVKEEEEDRIDLLRHGLMSLWKGGREKRRRRRANEKRID